MKMMYFSADRVEVESVAKEFLEAGISCEVRSIEVPAPSDAEVWIHQDQDAHRAQMLCVHLNIGFARRPGEKTAPSLAHPLEAAL